MRKVLIVSLSAACLAVAGCSSGPSYNETVKQCAAALEAQYKADGKGKPDECKGVKQDDYDALSISAAMGDLGWTDENGDFDENRMLDDATP